MLAELDKAALLAELDKAALLAELDKAACLDQRECWLNQRECWWKDFEDMDPKLAAFDKWRRHQLQGGEYQSYEERIEREEARKVRVKSSKKECTAKLRTGQLVKCHS